MDLPDLIADMALSIKVIDSRSPQAEYSNGRELSARHRPSPRDQAVDLIFAELASLRPDRHAGRLRTAVPYAGTSRQKCDLCVGIAPNWDWAVEIKMLRLIGDNGKPNDNMLTHVLSPYPADRSALTDCAKPLSSGILGRKVVVIYGFDYPDRPIDPAIDAFEILAARTVRLGSRVVGAYDSAVHPVHVSGRVFGWEIT